WLRLPYAALRLGLVSRHPSPPSCTCFTSGVSPFPHYYSSQHSKWVMGQFSCRPQHHNKIALVMSKPYDLTSYVAIDDVQFVPGPCKSEMDCDFDRDICGYESSIAKTDFEFARFIGG